MPMRRPIRIQPDEPEYKLDAMSRIDYARHYTVEYNVKAMPFGCVHKDSEREFLYSFKLVFFEDNPQLGQGLQHNVNDQTQMPDNAGRSNTGRARAGYLGAEIGSPIQSTTIGNYQQGQIQGSNPTAYGSTDQGYPIGPQSSSQTQSYDQHQPQGESQRQVEELRERERQDRLWVEQQRPEQQQQQYQSSPSRGQRRGRSSRPQGGQGPSRNSRGY